MPTAVALAMTAAAFHRYVRFSGEEKLIVGAESRRALLGHHFLDVSLRCQSYASRAVQISQRLRHLTSTAS